MLSNAKSVANNQIQTYNSPSVPIKNIGVVIDVILDNEDTLLQQSPQNVSYVGGVKFRILSDLASASGTEYLALPIDKSITDLPTKNEIVEILSISGVSYYKRFVSSPFQNFNADARMLDTFYSPTEEDGDKSRNYSQVSSTGIENISLPTNQTENQRLGEYFTPQQNIHSLKMYEGDWLVQSRFGQSIRLSAYNNSFNGFSPSTIIRNGENSTNQLQPITNVVEEDFNRDGSTLAFLSPGYELAFAPGSISDTGASDFQRAPIAFENYPNGLNGNQALLSSGRIILSSRDAETMIFSKGNVGVVTDSNFSVDSIGGIRFDVENSVNITTNGTDVNINTDSGRINLGNNELESLVKGETLVSLLSQLIDEINKIQLLTPSGPSAVGPVNAPKFNSIKSKLDSMLSSLNKTS